MCIHEFYLSKACGHHFPMVPPSAKPKQFFKDCRYKRDNTIAVPKSLTCDAVKLALKFYHDQVVYLPADMHCGSKVEIPKSCPIIHTPPGKYSKWTHVAWTKWFEKEMLKNGLGPEQKAQIQYDAAVLDRCSNRAKPNEHDPLLLRLHKECPYPLNMYRHVQCLKAYQEREAKFQMPNVRYHHVDFGCGGPFSAECLTGWDGIGLLTHRLHLWADTTTHPRPCSPECLTGWSGRSLGADLGAELWAHREQTWAGDRRANYRNLDYANLCEHVVQEAEHWVQIDYSNISHLHTDQFVWHGQQSFRIRHAPRDAWKRIPEKIWVPVPERLDQVLRSMRPVQPAPPPPPPPPPSPPTNPASSTESLLERLPEAFNEAQPLSARSPAPTPCIMTTTDDSAPRSPSNASTIVVEETPDEAEARGQRARQALREKIAQDFPRRLGIGEKCGVSES
ncbi:hypothetical protein BDR22DRAFT_920068 [Usnea florida]